jgi:hypothetical protein
VREGARIHESQLEAASWLWDELNRARVRLQADEVVRRSPAACDRLREAWFFAEKVLELPPDEDNYPAADWYVSAYLAAFTGIRDAAASDFESAGLGESFQTSELATEFFLRSDARVALDRDPLAANRAFWDLRNLRVHYAVPLVALASRPLMVDISRAEGDESVIARCTPKRWFMRAIDIVQHRRLRSPKLGDADLAKWNEYMQDKPLLEGLGRQLWIKALLIVETATKWPTEAQGRGSTP